MSAIASFFVVPHHRLAEIVGTASPKKRGWLRPPQDSFRNVLLANGKALDTFGWSGWAFGTLDLYLESRHGFMVEHFGDAPASAELSKARGSYWLILPQAAVEKMRAAIAPLEPSAEDVTQFVASEHGERDAATEAQAVRAALTMLKRWLADVPAGSAGLLSIG